MDALVASVAMANEPRLAAGILVMGGADPQDILAACDHEIKRGREHVLEQLGWSLDEYRNQLAKPLARINPARFAGMVNPRRVLIIEAAADTCMPRAARERLWQAMGRPERIAYFYGHRVAFLAMTFLGGNNLQEADLSIPGQPLSRCVARRHAAGAHSQVCRLTDAHRGGALRISSVAPACRQ